LNRSSIRYDFAVFLDDSLNEIAAEGSVTVVVLHHGKPAEIPPEIRSAYAD
jgi:acyl-CoA thioesterase FadM